MTKEMSRGVFWIIDNKLLLYPFTDSYPDSTAKSGNTYNHKKLWAEVKQKDCNHPYNYYPRSRVDITNKGKPIVYMNPPRMLCRKAFCDYRSRKNYNP